jgi:alginate O-acetyltransferase complex protein AlgI
MLFCSFEFFVFFFVVFVLYWLTPWHRARVWLLLVASYYFYASWNNWLALLIVVSTAIDYIIARAIEASASGIRRKFLLCVSLTANLGLLAYFKYANFFLRSLEQALQAAGAGASLPILQIILPIGISFYTFEAINYVVDVYRGKIKAERNLAHFMLFILFFPHLVAGPIVRARDFLPQISRSKRWDWPRLHLGMQYFVLGLFKKIAIADRMALFADPVFANPEQYNGGAIWIGVLAYSFQVYCDFSGYSDMALGAAHMLGYKLAKNFDMPYLSANIAEFWQRWHISLSTWLRDYLFIPLGGNRGGRWKTCRNLIVTMTLGGLWHGANWPFVLFGFIHGCWLSGHRMFKEWCEPRPNLTDFLRSGPGRVLRIAFTFLAFAATLVIFRSSSVSTAVAVFKGMIVPHAGMGTPLHNRSFWYLLTVVAAAHALGRNRLWQRWLHFAPAPVRGFSYALVLTVALVLSPEADRAFIYFQF